MKRFFVIALVLVPAALFAQGAPIGGTATIRLSTTSSAAIPGNPVVVDVNADLTGVTGSCSGTVAAVLGGYTIPVVFDNTQLQFVSAAACTSPEYSAAPTTTDAATANTAGQVSITASQTSHTAPAGNVCLARLTFNVIGGAGTTLTPANTASLSSAVQMCSAVPTGPASIPFTVARLVLTAAPIPALSTIALAALALAVAGIALFMLK